MKLSSHETIHGTLGNYDPAGSGTDMSDAQMSRWERSQPAIEQSVPYVLVEGNLADGLVIIELRQSRIDEGGEETDDTHLRNIGVKVLSDNNGLHISDSSREIEGVTYNLRVSFNERNCTQIFLSLDIENRGKVLLDFLKTEIMQNHIDTATMASVVTQKLKDLGIVSIVMD